MAKERDEGYVFPTPYDPHDYACFKVYVPRHTLYLGAFWNAYHFFTVWAAWMRDPLKTGKLVAQLWRVGFDRARAEYEATGGVCMANIIDIRQDPLNACNIQVRYDDGGSDEWVDKLDVSNCGGGGGGSGGCPTLRFNGSQIECYDTCSKTWTPIGQPTDPTIQLPVPGYYIGPPGYNCNALQNIAEEIKVIDKQIEGALADGESVLGAILTAFIAITQGFPITEWLATLAVGFAEADETLGNVWTDALAFDPLPFLRLAFAGNIQPDGTVTQDGLTAALAVMGHYHDIEPTLYGTVDLGNCINIMKVMGPGGLTRWNNILGITDADCSDLPWEHTFDFTVSTNGFMRVDLDGNGNLWGVYIPGQGWKSTTAPNSANHHESTYMGIALAMTPTHITYAGFTTTNVIGDIGAGVGVQTVRLIDGVVSTGTLIAHVDFTTSNTDLLTEFTLSDDFHGGVYLGIYIDRDTYAVPGASATINKLVLRGTGPDPFIASNA